MQVTPRYPAIRTGCTRKLFQWMSAARNRSQPFVSCRTHCIIIYDVIARQCLHAMRQSRLAYRGWTLAESWVSPASPNRIATPSVRTRPCIHLCTKLGSTRYTTNFAVKLLSKSAADAQVDKERGTEIGVDMRENVQGAGRFENVALVPLTRQGWIASFQRIVKQQLDTCS